MNTARQIIARMNAAQRIAWQRRISLCDSVMDAEGLLEEILTAAITATQEHAGAEK